MEVREELGRTEYRFEDIKCGEFFYAKEIIEDVTGEYSFDRLFLKIDNKTLSEYNAVRINESWESGVLAKFDNKDTVEYVKAEIIITERLKDHTILF